MPALHKEGSILEIFSQYNLTLIFMILGFAIDSDRTEWKRFRDEVKRAIAPFNKEYSDFVESHGLPPLEESKFGRYSPFMNIYGYPLELDYLDVRPLPTNWFRFDNLKRSETNTSFEIPDQLKDKAGKLIYISLGTIGSGNLVMMRRLIAILGESKHRFIVSLGPYQ